MKNITLTLADGLLRKSVLIATSLFYICFWHLILKFEILCSGNARAFLKRRVYTKEKKPRCFLLIERHNYLQNGWNNFIRHVAVAHLMAIFLRKMFETWSGQFSEKLEMVCSAGVQQGKRPALASSWTAPGVSLPPASL